MNKLLVLVVLAVLLIASISWSCSSDYDCVYGQQRCLKQPYQMKGTCVNIINEHGTQRYDIRPKIDSIKPGSDRPYYQACPPEFIWDYEYRVCVKIKS